MEIKNTPSSTLERTARSAKSRVAGGRLLRLLVQVVVIGALVVAAILVKRWATPRFDKPWTRVKHSVAALGTELPRVRVDMKFKHFRKLADLRDQHLARRVQWHRDDDWVPATLQVDGESYDVRMRLKGAALDHLDGETWSYRVKLKKGRKVFGMRTFSLQEPRMSWYASEWFFHRLLKEVDVLSFRYRYVDLTINGKHHGTYALEESLGKELVEANDRREGPIVRFDEDTREMWGRYHPPHEDVYLATDIDVAKRTSTEADPVLKKQYEVARSLLEGFRDRKLSVHEVFDVPRMARLFAVCDMTRGWHAARWKNILFYYNPVTGLLEPIGYNAHASSGVRPIDRLQTAGRYHSAFQPQWLDGFFRDPDFADAYVRAVAKLSEPGWLEGFFEKIEPELDARLRELWLSYPQYEFDFPVYYRNREIMRAATFPVMKARVWIDAAAVAQGQRQVHVHNVGDLAIEMLDLTDTRSGKAYAFPPGTSVGPKDSDEFVRVPLALPDGAEKLIPFAAGEVLLRYRVRGLLDVHEAIVEEQVLTPIRNLPRQLEEDAIDASAHEAFEVQGDALVLRPGTWRFDRNLKVPRGATLRAGAGSKIELGRGANVISYAPVELVGTAESPFVIQGVEPAAGGLVVLQAGGRSRVEHVQFLDLGTPTADRWEVTGSITFYESPVDIAHCLFDRVIAEDQLNLVRGAFSVKSTEFRGSFSDAFDVDFGTGLIEDCDFLDCGNDGVDVSGSDVTVSDCRFLRVGDKAVSVGENSRMRLVGIRIEKARFALVAKDFSHAEGERIQILDSVVGLCVFQKKPEFGPASVNLTGLVLTDVQFPRRIEVGSTVRIDGEEVAANESAIANDLYE